MTRLKTSAALCVGLPLIAACSQIDTTNRQVSAEYGMISNVGMINYEIINEVVQGRACGGDLLRIPVGANEFVSAGFDTNTPEGRAKAAAVHDALYGDEPGVLTMDIIAQPHFRTENNSIPML